MAEQPELSYTPKQYYALPKWNGLDESSFSEIPQTTCVKCLHDGVVVKWAAMTFAGNRQFDQPSRPSHGVLFARCNECGHVRKFRPADAPDLES